jgi:maltose O-acetyltransferase
LNKYQEFKMREKGKMLAGKPYRAFGEELAAERQAAKELIFEFNALHPSKIEQRRKIIQRLFGKTGKNFIIESPFAAIMDIIFSSGRTFTPIIIARLSTAPKLPSVITLLSRPM